VVSQIRAARFAIDFVGNTGWIDNLIGTVYPKVAPLGPRERPQNGMDLSEAFGAPTVAIFVAGKSRIQEIALIQ